ncbi:hypothetical protein [Paractinoplanes aksuensis]|nr:hypothetical protein [Actinoplanes aksuensis]
MKHALGRDADITVTPGDHAERVSAPPTWLSRRSGSPSAGPAA